MTYDERLADQIHDRCGMACWGMRTGRTKDYLS